MPYFLFLWTDENERQLSEHGIGIEEFEEIVQAPDFIETSRTTGRPIAFGYASSGRFIACVYEMIDDATVYPITAYEIES